TATIEIAARQTITICRGLAVPSLNFSMGSASSSASIRTSGLPDADRRFSSAIVTSIVGTSATIAQSAGARLAVERKHAIPVVLHADDRPAVLLRLCVELGRERADLTVGQPLRGPVGILALVVVVQHQHLQPRACAGAGVLQHLAVTGRVAERRVRPAADHEVNTL